MLKKNDNQNFAFRDENTEVQSITESYRHLGPILLKSGQGGFIPKTFQGLHFFAFWGTYLVNKLLSYLLVKQI